MTRPLALAATALALTLPATGSRADALTDRALAASEAMMGTMVALLEQCAPSLRGDLGDGTLSPQMAAATVCQVEGLRDRMGRRQTRAYVEALEALGTGDYDSFAAFMAAGESYPILNDPALDGLAQDCKAVEASMTTPMAKAMQTNMAALAPCFGG